MTLVQIQVGNQILGVVVCHTCYPQRKALIHRFLCTGLLGVVVGGSATKGVRSILRHSERSEGIRAFPQEPYRAVDNLANWFANLEQVFDGRFDSKLRITPLGVWHPREPDEQASEGRRRTPASVGP
jgi:hypothetical protein